jgi:hypothetical protein
MERRSNCPTLSLIRSPMSSFSTDLSGISLITLFPRKTPSLFITESATSSTSLLQQSG